jgi:anthranilate synthase component 1
MYFLNLDECQIVGASPEILVRLEDQEVTLRPMAGTRKRGQNSQEDESNKKDLLSDPKEIAEHLMLIDLGRNDVGRVSKIGSVQVTDKMIVEKYSHVMHIVSNVVGKLTAGLSYFDVLKAALPAGTLSGAPKIRAMEIINELEPSSRGIYGGAIGYIGWNGNMDTAIAIRTAVIKDKIIHVGAGAGIVADSMPESEWLECRQKSKVFMDAMEMIL